MPKTVPKTSQNPPEILPKTLQKPQHCATQDSADQLQGWKLQDSALQHDLPQVAATARAHHTAAIDTLHAAAQGAPNAPHALTALTEALHLLSTWTTSLQGLHACLVFDAQATALRTWPGVDTFDAVPYVHGH